MACGPWLRGITMAEKMRLNRGRERWKKKASKEGLDDSIQTTVNANPDLMQSQSRDNNSDLENVDGLTRIQANLNTGGSMMEVAGKPKWSGKLCQKLM